jgi:hypothetical protein
MLLARLKMKVTHRLPANELCRQGNPLQVNLATKTRTKYVKYAYP